MPVGWGTVYLNTPEAKVFDITVTENEVVGTATNMLFAAGGMTNLNAPAQEKIVQEVTPSNVVMTIDVEFGISGPTTTGFTLVKSSAAGVGAIVHTFRVYMHSRRFYQ